MVEARDERREGIDVGDVLDLVAVALYEVADHDGHAVVADVLEKVEAGGVEEVVAWHGVEEGIENWLEELFLDHLLVVELIVEAEEVAEELQRGWGVVSYELYQMQGVNLLSFKCFSGQLRS